MEGCQGSTEGRQGQRRGQRSLLEVVAVKLLVEVLQVILSPSSAKGQESSPRDRGLAISWGIKHYVGHNAFKETHGQKF